VIRPDETAYWDDHGLPELRASMPQVALLMKTQVFFFCAPVCLKWPCSSRHRWFRVWGLGFRV
jgi:hypothetical protein